MLPILQILKTAALKNDKDPETNYIDEEEEKHLSSFILQFWSEKEWESKVFKTIQY